jgi:2-hydroxychromene-2-carboxylate isomerase
VVAEAGGKGKVVGRARGLFAEQIVLREDAGEAEVIKQVGLDAESHNRLNSPTRNYSKLEDTKEYTWRKIGRSKKEDLGEEME